MSREGDFLSRWARRKADAREAESSEAEKTAAIPSDTAAHDAAAAGQDADDKDRPATEEEIAALPDPDKLEHGADFKPFLRPGIPEALRQRALRRLWRVNPAIGFLDGMNDYDLDYTDAATVVENLKTAYDAVKGYAFPEDEELPATGSAEAAGEAAPATADGLPPPETHESETHAEESPQAAELEPGSEDAGALSATGAAQQPADEAPESPEDEAKSGAATMAAVTDSRRQPSEPGQAAARRWARFSTSLER